MSERAPAGGRIIVQTYVGDEVEPLVPELARLRQEVFRAYPYLYEGTAAYEEEYLRAYSASPASVFVVAREPAGAVVGVSTALPLADADAAFQAPFRAAGIAVDAVFYLGESVLRAAWRGHGVGHRFFDEREAFARGRFAWAAFCAVDRGADDPRRPAGYRPLDPFWRRRGYERRPDLQARYDWQEVGGDAEVPHTMTFWLKRLAGADPSEE